MPEITYPYLPEGEAFDANSLNTRFRTVTDGLNGLVEFSTQRGTFSDQHLTSDGLIAGDSFPASGAAGTTRYSRNTEDVSTVVLSYTTWGGNGTYPGVGDTDRQLITDGTVDLQITFSSAIQLGMGNPSKIAGLLVLLNVHFYRAFTSEPATFSPEISLMTCIQYTTDNVNWFTLKRTERIQRVRTVKGEGHDINTTQRGNMSTPDEDDTYVSQDIPTRTLILPEDLPDPNLSITAIRAATALWQPGGVPALTIGYIREANFTVMPLHAGV